MYVRSEASMVVLYTFESGLTMYPIIGCVPN